jgi:DNA repair photolyase
MNASTSPLFLPALPAFGRTAPSSQTLPTSLEALEKKLRQAARRGQPIVLGTAAAPYSPEASTRPLLAALSRTEGLLISITTRSPLILCHLELLTELDRRHAVAVDVMVPAADPALAARLEPDGSEPRALLSAVCQLAEEGIDTRVICAPVLPGVNDGEEALRPLLAAARKAGAREVLASTVHLRRAARQRFLTTFRHLRLEYGFPQAQPGRG